MFDCRTVVLKVAITVKTAVAKCMKNGFQIFRAGDAPTPGLTSTPVRKIQ
jgi:hypothetical protein